MGRKERIDVADLVYHVINRANARARIFKEENDYLEFEYLLSELKETFDIRILAYIIMPNHWHLLLSPRNDGDLSKSMQWLGTTHARRIRTQTRTVGEGHLYQGRYKAFLVQRDAYLISALKYIERNAVRAGLCERPEDWKWGSAYRRVVGSEQEHALLDTTFFQLPNDYVTWINTPEPSEELEKSTTHHK